MNVFIEPLTAGKAERDTDFWKLYKESFPDSERESPDIILKTLRHENGCGLRAKSDGRTVGLLVAQYLQKVQASFLSYIAVQSSAERKDIGTRLLMELKTRTANRYPLGNTAILLEIDRVHAEDIDERERSKRLRRRGFFTERHGGQVLPILYEQPPLNVKFPEKVPMDFLVIPLTGTNAFDEKDWQSWVDAVFEEKYGAMNGISKKILMDTRQDIFG